MDLKIDFAGVCTHVWWTDSIPPYTSRVVLVNASAGDHIRGRDIKPHVATLRVLKEDVVNGDALRGARNNDPVIDYLLAGARVRVNATSPVHKDPSFRNCIYSLRELTPALGMPSREAVDDGVPDRTACIFDVTGGTLHGRVNPSGAAYASLETDTQGDPTVTIFNAVTHDSIEIILKPGAEITISNLGATEQDDDLYDFYLHYRLAATMPKDPGLPGPDPRICLRPAPGATWPPNFGSVGPGCSNSAYP